MISSFTHLQDIKKVFSVVCLKCSSNCVAVHNQNPPHYSLVSVYRKYVLLNDFPMRNTFCDLCQTHKCLVSTIGTARCESSFQLHRGQCRQALTVVPMPSMYNVFWSGKIREAAWGLRKLARYFLNWTSLLWFGFNPLVL